MPFESLQAALDEGKVPVDLIPTWIPDGFKLSAIEVEHSPLQIKYTARYENGEGSLVITVRDHLDGIPTYVEQRDGLIEEYKVAGITYYLFSDVSQMKAKWVRGSYECDIYGSVTIEELKIMIDSIEKG